MRKKQLHPKQAPAAVVPWLLDLRQGRGPACVCLQLQSPPLRHQQLRALPSSSSLAAAVRRRHHLHQEACVALCGQRATPSDLPWRRQA